MRPKEVYTKQPEECQAICRAIQGCAWFTWKARDTGDSGKCILLSTVNKVLSDDSTKGIISGPAKCGGMHELIYII